jgi:tetratricopeptide (TPR) repeat protein
MGRKQWKNRERLLFYGASLLVILVITQGCAISEKLTGAITEKLAKDKIHIEATPMELARNRMQNGDYEGALKAYMEILKANPEKFPGDRALFEMGILFAYPDNPKRSNSKASGYFKRLIKEFPESYLIRESLAWVDALNKIGEYEARIKTLAEKNRVLKEKVAVLEKKDMECEGQIGSYEEQIRALKEIDIGIEEKKRQGAPQ